MTMVQFSANTAQAVCASVGACALEVDILCCPYLLSILHVSVDDVHVKGGEPAKYHSLHMCSFFAAS